MAYDALNQQTDTSKQVNVLVVQVMNLLQNINFQVYEIYVCYEKNLLVKLYFEIFKGPRHEYKIKIRPKFSNSNSERLN